MADTNQLVAEVDGVCGGRATIVGRRIEVRHVLGWMAGGATVEEIAADYDLSMEQVKACLAWSCDLVERHYGIDRHEPVGRLVSRRAVERHAPS